MSQYKKYYKKITIPEKKDEKPKKIDLTKPLKIEDKKLSEAHSKLIKNALIIQQRQFENIKRKSTRLKMILEKHNQVIKKKKLENVIDIFKLIKFLD